MKIKTSIGNLYYSKGNSKVDFPIFNVGSGTECPSRKWCPFDKDNHKQAGRPLCYAQKTERLRPSVLQSRNENARIIREIKTGEMHGVTLALAKGLAKYAKYNIVRLNESGDLSSENIAFVYSLINNLKKLGIRAYLYSKAPSQMRIAATHAGAVVLHSERKFIAIARGDTPPKGFNQCPGKCGLCQMCPNAENVWIYEH